MDGGDPLGEPRVFPDACLAPMSRARNRLLGIVTLYGLRDAGGRAIEGWPLLTSMDTTFALNWPRRKDDGAARIPRAIYGGLYSSAFGHFLTETVPSLAAIRHLAMAEPGVPIVLHVPDQKKREGKELWSRRPYVDWFLERLGIDFGRLMIVRAPMRVGELLVGQSPFSGKQSYRPWVPQVMDAVFGSGRAGTDRLYLSRTKWPRPRIEREAEVEEVFRQAGFTVTHLQDLSLEQQLLTVCQARHLAGPQGTALHWSLYSASVRGVISLGFRSPLQRGICQVRGQTYLNPPGRKVRDAGLRVRAIGREEIEDALSRLS